MLRELVPTSSTTLWPYAAEPPVSQPRPRSVSAMTELFVPLDRLLSCGGDPRLSIDPASRVNEYGCQAFPCPDTLSFASSTATSISERASNAGTARDNLQRELGRVGAIVSKIEWLVTHMNDLHLSELCHEA
jgi:hypothetical protein